MNSEVLQFSCGNCQHVLTVPAHLAGISGPCPVCGTTVSSPAPTMAAAPAFAPPAFGGVPQMQQPSGFAPPPAPSMPVMPLPGAFPMPGSGPSGGGFFPPAQAPAPQQAAPTWQNPGLGQTILESIPQPQQPQPQTQSFMQPQAPMASGPESFLPQRRNDGQAPFPGSLLGGAPAAAPQPAQPAWGGGFAAPAAETVLPPQRQSHSGLIPGSPTLPMMGGPGMGAHSQEGTLLARGMPSAPLAGTMPLRENSGGLSLPASPVQSRSRPLHKPKRATNVFMIGLALLFLGGFLLAAGWLFREPIMQVVQTVKAMIPSSEQPAELVEAEPAPESVDATTPKPITGAEPKLATTTPPEPKVGGFDPDEAPPQAASLVPTPAMPKADEEVAMIRRAEPVTAPEPIASVPAPMPTPAPLTTSSGLVEVKPAPGMPKADETAIASSGITSTSSREVRLDDVTEEAKPAAEALKKFLSAANLQERIQHTLAADVMRSTMERYYGANADGPIVVDAIALVRYDPKPQVGGGAHAVFGLESKTWEFPVPVMLEMNEGRFKVDWLSFVEFKDRLMEKFLAGYQEGRARFHVGITRTHYFEDKVPNASSKDAFRISPAPPNPYASVVFVDRDSDVGRELRDKIPWGSQVWAIVELEWTKLGPQNWVQLAAVPQLNWYSVPNAQRGGPASPIADDAQVPTETQKAVPVGR